MFRRLRSWRLWLAVGVLVCGARAAAAQTVLTVNNATDFTNAAATIFGNPNTSYVVNVNSSFMMTSAPDQRVMQRGNGVPVIPTEVIALAIEVVPQRAETVAGLVKDWHPILASVVD